MVNISNGKDAPGAEIPDSKVPDIGTIKHWLVRDINTAFALLSALREDQELQDQMAVFMHGRYMNHFHRPKEGPNGKFPV